MIHGTEDMLVPIENAYFLQEMLPNATFDIIKDENHFLPWVQYELVKKRILEVAE